MKQEMQLIFTALSEQLTFKNKFITFEKMLNEILQEGTSTLTITVRDNPNGGIIGPRGLIIEEKTAVELIILFKLGYSSTAAYVSVTVELKTDFGEVVGAVKNDKSMSWHRDLRLVAKDVCVDARKQLFNQK